MFKAKNKPIIVVEAIINRADGTTEKILLSQPKKKSLFERLSKLFRRSDK